MCLVLRHSRDNDRSCHLILPRFSRSKYIIHERNLSYWKFGLFGDCSYTFVFNDSSVVRLKEYKEIHKEARLL